MLIEATRAAFGYGGRAIVHVDQLSLCAGQCLGMFGPNGSGKTTLVRGLAGLMSPMSGSVRRQPDLRIGYMQQQCMMEWHWPMSALDAAAIASSTRRRFGWMGHGALRTVRQSMQLLEVGELAHDSFSSLSGGQQQRVLLAGALATDPQVLILDEPTEGLDIRSRQLLLQGLRDAAKHGLAIIMISHALDDLSSLCEQVAWLHDAESAQEPSHADVLPIALLMERIVTMRQSN